MTKARKITSRGWVAKAAMLGVLSGTSVGAMGVPPTFQEAIGTQLEEQAMAVQSTRDGGFISVGYRRGQFNAGRDILVTKHNQYGIPQWERVLVGPGEEVAFNVRQTLDGGYAIAAESTSIAGLGTAVIKLTAAGGFVWAEMYQGAPLLGTPLVTAIEEMKNGDLVVVSRVATGVASHDATIIRVRANGVALFSNRYHDARYENNSLTGFTDVREWFDTAGVSRGLVISGYTERDANSVREATILRTDSAGLPLQYRVGFAPNTDAVATGIDSLMPLDWGMSLRLGNTVFGGAGSGFARFDSLLNVTSERQYGTFLVSHASIQERSPSTQIILAGTYPAAGPIAGDEAALLNVDPAGNPIWERIYGGAVPNLPGVENFNGVWPTLDGGLIAAGLTGTFGFGNGDLYLVKTDSGGVVDCLQKPVQPQSAPLQIPFTDVQLTMGGIQHTPWQPNVIATVSQVQILCIRCPADFDGDGAVDIFDYDAFVAAFEAGLMSADFDGDGTVDFFDYDAYVVAFETPCP